MATAAPTTPHGARATGKSTHSSCPDASRRAMLAGLALAPIAALPVASAALGRALPVPTGAWPRWKAAVARFEAATAALDFAQKACSPLEERFFAKRPAQPVAEAWNDDLHPDAWEGKVLALRAAKADWRTSSEAVRVECGLAAADERRDRAYADHEAALRQLLATPAPSLAIVAEKLRVAAAEEMDLEDLVDPLLADLNELGSPRQ